jgi:colicin import membrane protein
MAKSKSTKKKSKQDEAEKAAQQKAQAKAKAKAAAKLAVLVEDAKKAEKTADKAAKAADKARAKAVAAGAPEAKRKPEEAELLKLALRSTEAKLTDAERKVEALERQIADLHAADDAAVEEEVADAVIDAAVAATVVDAVVDVAVVDEALTIDVTDAAEAEAVAAELDEILAETEAETAAIDPEPDHGGEAAEAATVFAGSDAGAEPTVTTTELTPPLPAEPADDQPSASWTLLQLRTEAKKRGLTGTSNLPKAALLERLRTS